MKQKISKTEVLSKQLVQYRGSVVKKNKKLCTSKKNAEQIDH